MTRYFLKIAPKVNKTVMLKTFVNLSNVIRRRLIKITTQQLTRDDTFRSSDSWPCDRDTRITIETVH